MSAGKEDKNSRGASPAVQCPAAAARGGPGSRSDTTPQAAERSLQEREADTRQLRAEEPRVEAA